MAKTKITFEAIDVVAELRERNVEFEPVGSDEVRFKCPFHEDESPSCNANTAKKVFKCHAANCGAQGDIVKLLARISGATREATLSSLKQKYPIEIRRTINPATIERYHKKIWDCSLIQALYDRGLEETDIREARLGFDGDRITIPVFSQSGEVIDVRRSLPGASRPEKMKNTPGYGGINIYLIEQLKFKQIWICGGEMKALVAKRILNPHGVGALCLTAGEGNWDPALNFYFKGKTVYVVMDVDEGGVVAARKVAAYLGYTADDVRIGRLPLDKHKYPKGDINDWVAKERAGSREFLDLMQSSEKWIPPTIDEVQDSIDVKKVRLSEALRSEQMGLKLEVEAIVSTMDTTPYLVPRKVGVTCSKDQPGCPWCPIYSKEFDQDTGYVNCTINATNLGVLDMVNSAKRHQKEAIRESLKIPSCKTVKFHVKSHYEVYDISLVPQLTIGNESAENVVVPAYAVGVSPDMNTPYVFQGRLHPRPQSQLGVLLIDKAEQSDDSLKSFAPSLADLCELDIFRPSEMSVQGIEDKLAEIYTDFETNVTRIFRRRDLHLVLDLCYHSALFFPFDNQVVKGWVNVLVAGDSSQGKTETTLRMIEHYGLGERVDCKNASSAGLQGGLIPVGQRWFVQWGVIPTHDRRMVVLEEIKGTNPEEWAKLTDMRSSGIAEISKIQKRRAFARTRLAFLSNPRSGRPVSAYNFGIEIIKELLGGLEDIRRLDLATIVSSLEIDPREINRLSSEISSQKHIFKSSLCRHLVLWAWTRTPEQVVFAEGSEKACLESATRLCERFTDALPLVDRGTMRHKIARLSVALAARLFSSSEDRTKIVVHPCHVEFMEQFINRLYSSRSFGYDEFSKAQIHANHVVGITEVRRAIFGTKYPVDLVDNLLYAEEITVNDVADWCELERDDAQKLLSLFVRKHALYRNKRWYLKTSHFITLLKQWKAEGIPSAAAPQKGEEF